MRYTLLIVAFCILAKANAQLEKNDFLIGAELCFNNKVATQMNDKLFWYARALAPVGLNMQFSLTDYLSIGLRGNVAKLDVWYDDGYRELDKVDFYSYSGGLYSIVHYYNTEHCVVGSGLSVGYRTATYDFGDFTFGDEGWKYDVIILDLKAIFVEHLGAQLNIYLSDNYSSFASVGMFWRF